MTPARAAEVLRYKKLVGPDDWDAAREMGAEALELLQWWFTEANEPQREAVRRQRDQEGTEWTSGQWIAVARAEWEKERRT
jgi:hypothetical protein